MAPASVALGCGLRFEPDHHASSSPSAAPAARRPSTVGQLWLHLLRQDEVDLAVGDRGQQGTYPHCVAPIIDRHHEERVVATQAVLGRDPSA